MMELKPLQTEPDYQAALSEIEQLWQAKEADSAGSAEANKLELLSLLVEIYEKAHYPIAAPDPIGFLQYIMQARGLTRKDLEQYIGPRGRVSDIINRVRPLTLEMIRRLAAGLDIPASVLIQYYPLQERAA
ncbi:MAG: helix-turn-helix domain-containing protein [Candidatus Nitrotoga sp.]